MLGHACRMASVAHTAEKQTTGCVSVSNATDRQRANRDKKNHKVESRLQPTDNVDIRIKKKFEDLFVKSEQIFES